MANKPSEDNFFPNVPEFPSMGVFQPIYGKFDLTTYIQGASDYEIMAFLVGKYNACLEAYGNITKLSTDTITACKQLQDWINSWFTNLDVQKELNEKINSMVQDGSFERLLHETFNTQINQQINTAVTNWLVANVTPTGSAVIVDNSLTISGAAADSKTVGDILNPIKGEQYYDSTSGVFYQSYIDKTGTEIEYKLNNYYTSDFIPVEPGTNITYLACGINNVAYAVAFFTADRTHITENSVSTTGISGIIQSIYGSVIVPSNAAYVRFSYSSNINPFSYLTFKTNGTIIPDLSFQMNNIYNTLFDIGDATIKPLYNNTYLGEHGFSIDVRCKLSAPIIAVPSVKFSYTITAIAEIQYAIIATDQYNNILKDECVIVHGVGGKITTQTSEYVPSAQCKYLYFSWINNQPTFTVPTYVPKRTETTYTQWKGKKWCAFGTSLTDTNYIGPEPNKPSGRYIPYLRELSRSIITNKGIAGGKLCNYGLFGTNTGNGTILNAILTTDLSEYDIVTFEGFVNDYAASTTIGNLTDTTNETFYGCLYLAVNYAQSNSHGVVALIGDSTGKTIPSTGANYSYSATNSIGLHQRDYVEAMKKFAEYCGCLFIDAGQTSEINVNNPQYIYDHIHHTELGGKQFAQAIWNVVKNITPNAK